MPDIPYLFPYTMPDGSTRRPIVERVPECLPVRHPNADGGPYLLREGIDCWKFFQFDRMTKYPSRSDGSSFDKETALALCRVACEDWLRSTACDGYLMLMSITYAGPRQKVFYSGEVMEERDEDDCEFYGETINHALNAAAHAVADAKGIEP